MSRIRVACLYRCLGIGLLAVWLWGATIPLTFAQEGAQEDANAVPWALVVDGTPASWPTEQGASPPDSVRAAAQVLARHYQRRGYLHATVDSATVHAEPPPRATFYVSRGPRAAVDAVVLEGADALPEQALRRTMELRSGAPLDQYVLDGDLHALREAYRAEGYPLARVGVAAIRPTDDTETVTVHLSIDEGPQLWLKSIVLEGAERTRPAYVARAAGLAFDAPLRDYDGAALQQALEGTGLFEQVERPAIQIDADGGATLTVPLEERPPGVFDLVLGLLPDGGVGGSTALVGSGRLELENLFGGGREADLHLDQRPGRTSAVNVRLRDPFLLGRALDAEAAFSGVQRDSSYSTQSYRASLGYDVQPGWQVRATATRNVTRPGPRGQALQQGEQRVARSRSLRVGVGLRINRVDSRRSPRQGLRADLLIEQGRQQRTGRRVVEGDTVRTQQTGRPARMQGHLRTFWPVGARQVVVAGGNARGVFTESYDISDLFRLGGFDSLRGYDEDRFIGRFVGRILVEHRLFVDRTSFVFAFAETGWVDRPEIEGRAAATSWHPSAGIGAELRTGLGRVNISYAMNPDDGGPTDGRVHLGLAVAL